MTALGTLLLVGSLALAVAGAQVLRTRAAAAADLSALAAASAALAGADVACARAADVAAANDARLDACRLTATHAWVEVGVATFGAVRELGAPPEVRARAHAELVPEPGG